MKTITFYFDPISPFAWLAFAQLPQALMGSSYRVVYKPVLFAALLKAHGQRGPAEIPAKRDWTYRHVLWLGHSLGIPLALPAGHPFNPLPLLRLAVACASPDEPGACNRWVAEQVLRHVWQGGSDAADPVRLAVLRERLAEHMQRRGLELADPDGEAVKQQLRVNTEEALAQGAFGVPTSVVDGRLFWGLDGLSMLKACLDGDAWFDGGDWSAVQDVPVSVQRLPC
jgi:2-hydroxychromene-2-carboxylate isomerase